MRGSMEVRGSKEILSEIGRQLDLAGCTRLSSPDGSSKLLALLHASAPLALTPNYGTPVDSVDAKGSAATGTWVVDKPAYRTCVMEHLRLNYLLSGFRILRARARRHKQGSMLNSPESTHNSEVNAPSVTETACEEAQRISGLMKSLTQRLVGSDGSTDIWVTGEPFLDPRTYGNDCSAGCASADILKMSSRWGLPARDSLPDESVSPDGGIPTTGIGWIPGAFQNIKTPHRSSTSAVRSHSTCSGDSLARESRVIRLGLRGESDIIFESKKARFLMESAPSGDAPDWPGMRGFEQSYLDLETDPSDSVEHQVSRTNICRSSASYSGNSQILNPSAVYNSNLEAKHASPAKPKRTRERSGIKTGQNARGDSGDAGGVGKLKRRRVNSHASHKDKVADDCFSLDGSETQKTEGATSSLLFDAAARSGYVSQGAGTKIEYCRDSVHRNVALDPYSMSPDRYSGGQPKRSRRGSTHSLRDGNVFKRPVKRVSPASSFDQTSEFALPSGSRPPGQSKAAFKNSISAQSSAVSRTTSQRSSQSGPPSNCVAGLGTLTSSTGFTQNPIRPDGLWDLSGSSSVECMVPEPAGTDGYRPNRAGGDAMNLSHQPVMASNVRPLHGGLVTANSNPHSGPYPMYAGGMSAPMLYPGGMYGPQGSGMPSRGMLDSQPNWTGSQHFGSHRQPVYPGYQAGGVWPSPVLSSITQPPGGCRGMSYGASGEMQELMGVVTQTSKNSTKNVADNKSTFSKAMYNSASEISGNSSATIGGGLVASRTDSDDSGISMSCSSNQLDGANRPGVQIGQTDRSYALQTAPSVSDPSASIMESLNQYRIPQSRTLGGSSLRIPSNQQTNNTGRAGAGTKNNNAQTNMNGSDDAGSASRAFGKIPSALGVGYSNPGTLMGSGMMYNIRGAPYIAGGNLGEGLWMTAGDSMTRNPLAMQTGMESFGDGQMANPYSQLGFGLNNNPSILNPQMGPYRTRYMLQQRQQQTPQQDSSTDILGRLSKSQAQDTSWGSYESNQVTGQRPYVFESGMMSSQNNGNNIDINNRNNRNNNSAHYCPNPSAGESNNHQPWEQLESSQ